MAKIRNTRYAGKSLCIGSYGTVTFNSAGICECKDEIARNVQGLDTFEVLELKNTPEITEPPAADEITVDTEAAEKETPAENLAADQTPAENDQTIPFPKPVIDQKGPEKAVLPTSRKPRMKKNSK